MWYNSSTMPVLHKDRYSININHYISSTFQIIKLSDIHKKKDFEVLKKFYVE